MPKLRHLALYCGSPQQMVNFYERGFGMKEPHRRSSRETDGLHLSDGVMDLVLMPYRAAEKNFEYRTSSASGIGHIGFWFDEAEAKEIGSKLRRLGAVRAGSGIDSGMIEGNWSFSLPICSEPLSSTNLCFLWKKLAAERLHFLT